MQALAQKHNQLEITYSQQCCVRSLHSSEALTVKVLAMPMLVPDSNPSKMTLLASHSYSLKILFSISLIICSLKYEQVQALFIQ